MLKSGTDQFLLATSVCKNPSMSHKKIGLWRTLDLLLMVKPRSAKLILTPNFGANLIVTNGNNYLPHSLSYCKTQSPDTV